MILIDILIDSTPTPKRPNGLYMKCFVNIKLVCDTPVFKSAHMLVKLNAKSNINQILLNMQNNADVSISANTCNSFELRD